VTMRGRSIRLAAALITISLVLGTMLLPRPVRAAEGYPLAGSWSATVSGSGSFNLVTEEVTSGTFVIQVQVSGDITGNFEYVATYQPAAGGWEGTTAAVEGTITVDGVDHPGIAWLKGDIVNLNFTGWPPTAWDAEVFCPSGGTHGYTTDGSDIVADFGWQGSCSGSATTDIASQTWQASGSGSGTWSGTANQCLAGITRFVGAGTGTVTLAASPIVASLSYDIAQEGTFILARYQQNPAGATARPSLDRYIQVDTNLVKSDVNFDRVELRIYYNEDDLASQNIDEASLAIYRWSGSEWTRLAETGVNTGEDYVWAKLVSFSVYSVQGETSTTPAATPPEEQPAPAPAAEQPAPASFSVSNLSITPAKITAGAQASVRFTVTNTGGSDGEYTAALKLNGREVDRQTLHLAAGASATAEFVLSAAEPGSYEVSIGQASGQLEVVAPEAGPEVISAEPAGTPTAPPTPEPAPAGGTPWPIVGGVAGAVAVTAIGLWLWRRR